MIYVWNDHLFSLFCLKAALRLGLSHAPLATAALDALESWSSLSFYQLHLLVTISVSSMMCEGAVEASRGIMASYWETASMLRLRGGFEPDSLLEC